MTKKPDLSSLRAVDAVPLTCGDEGLANALRRAADLLDNANNVVVVAHQSPDGDAIGSTLGMALVCEALGHQVTRFNVDPAPENLRFMPGVELLTAVPPETTPDLTIVLDCSTAERTGAADMASLWGDKVLVLDHHSTVDREFADVLVHDETAAATAELVYRVASASGIKVTPELATCLFAALHTDTGSFRYSATDSAAMELAQRLLETGIDVWSITSELYESRSLPAIRLLARTLDAIEVSPCGRLATLVVDRKMLRDTGTTEQDADGYINYARSIRGVEVAAQLTESDDRSFRVSFRSRGRIDVSLIAVQFGGGGHKNAAGCTIEGELREVRSALTSALEQVLVAP